MSNETPILPEDLFRRELGDFEPPHDPHAWEHMRALLDKEQDVKPVILIPETNDKKPKSITLLVLIMISVSIISIATWMSLGYNAPEAGNAAGNNKNTSSESPVAITENRHADIPSYQSFESPGTDENTDAEAAEKENGSEAGILVQKANTGSKRNKPGTSVSANGKSRTAEKNQGFLSAGPVKTNTQSKTAVPADSTKKSSVIQNAVAATGVVSAAKQAVGQVTAANVLQQSTKLPPDSPKITNPAGKYRNVVVRKTWVPDRYEYTLLPNEKAIDDFWIGMHFTRQYKAAGDTLNGDRQQAGFNIQFMSGNGLKKKTDNIGLYGGFDWGMQFYGRSANSKVVLNTVNQDSGYTRLHSSSMDFLGRAHLEYSRFKLVPYINAMAGPRLYSTGQKVASYLPLKNTESSNTQNAHTSVSMMYGVGVGARLRLGSVISLDMRYELLRGTPVKVVDLDASKFNGLSYDLVLRKINPNYSQFKVGIIFELSERKEEKKLVTPGHYIESTYDSVYVDPKDSSVRYLPCPCNPCESIQPGSDKTKQPFPDNNDNNNEGTPAPSNRRDRNIHIPSGSSGSGKGSFPGIRPPVITK